MRASKRRSEIPEQSGDARPVRTVARLSLLFAIAGVLLAQETTIGGQLVDHRPAPIGLEARQPRFSWQLRAGANGRRQTAWQIQVARSAETFAAGGSVPVWDSGWVESDQSHLIPYAGVPLVSSTDYYWRVRIKDESGRISAWSATTRWVTGLLDVRNELKADWIGFPLSLALFAGTLFAAAPALTKPNIIIILSDDHGYTDLGIHGIDPSKWSTKCSSLARAGSRNTVAPSPLPRSA